VIDVFLREQGLVAKDVKVHMTIGSPELVVQMVQAGRGIAFASKWSAFKALKEGSLRLLRFSNKKLVRHFYLVHLEGGAASPPVKTFRAFINEYKFFAPF
jgi:DNA-binding transcriptional LysR family regulator